MKRTKTLSLILALLLVLQLLPLGVASADGGEGRPPVDLLSENWAFIHDITGNPNPNWDDVGVLKSNIIIKDSGGTTIPPTISGDYEDIPANASIDFQVAFHLTDTMMGEDFVAGDHFELSLPAGVSIASPQSGNLVSKGITFASWTINTEGELVVTLLDDVKPLSTT